MNGQSIEKQERVTADSLVGIGFAFAACLLGFRAFIIRGKKHHTDKIYTAGERFYYCTVGAPHKHTFKKSLCL